MTLRSVRNLRPIPHDPAIKHCRRTTSLEINRAWEDIANTLPWLKGSIVALEKVFLLIANIYHDTAKSVPEARLNYSDSCLGKDGEKIECFRTLFCLQQGCQYRIHLCLSYRLKIVTVFNFYILWCLSLQLFQKHQRNYFTVADAVLKI